MDSSFVKAPIKVPNLSGFDKSHQNLLTTKVGTITPILIDELIPGSKVNLKLALSASLPPLASETFMRCSVKCEAFFIPFRILCGSFESWFTDQAKSFQGPTNTFEEGKGLLPTFGLFDDATLARQQNAGYFNAGSLLDFLGMRTFSTNGLKERSFSAMPLLAYHRVYQDWYRNSLVQRECFLPVGPTADAGMENRFRAGAAPFTFYSEGNNTYQHTYRGLYNSDSSLVLADGVSLFALRQRNFGLDYFTTSTPRAQQGDPATVSFSTAGQTGNFSIAALRASNAMQQFRERNNISGNLYVEQLYSRYGVRPSDGVAQRSLYLGSADFEVYSKGIYENSNTTGIENNNPFGGTVGARYGSAYASGNSTLVSGFEAKEPGYLLVNATLVPRVTYSSGIHQRFNHYVGEGSLSDLANPILQSVGPQPILISELNGVPSADLPFGYTDRYATFKTMEDELHGILRDGYSLESFALQRNFGTDTSPQINSAFLTIPVDYLDQVAAVEGSVSEYGCWIDSYFDYKVAQPLAKYSLPTLQDPAYEHGKTLVINRGGFKL